MTDTSWVLKGVDPEVREQAAEEAARLGLSLSDYLSETLLRTALREQAAEAHEDIVPETQQVAPDAGFAPRHRIEAVERRLGVAFGTFESAIQALDNSLVELSARVEETEAVANEASEALVQTVQEIGANLNALRKRLSDAEDATETLGEAHEERLDIVDAVAHGAAQAAADLARAQEALKHAVAEDFSELARDTTDRLAAGLSDVRDAAEIAAEQADAAMAHLVVELRSARDHLEQSLAESVLETRARVQAVFNESSERIGGLADRLTVNERAAAQLRAQLSDVEDGAQTALEETAETLRQAGAALATEFARAAQDNRIALESIHADLSNEIAGLRERQAGDAARIKLIDGAVGNTASEISAIRQLVGSAMGDISAVRDGLAEAESSIAAVCETFDARFAESEDTTKELSAHLRAEVSARFEAGAAYEEERQHRADETLAAFRLETERIEACALAALEQLHANIAAGDDALQAKVDARLTEAENATDALIAQVAQRLEGQITELRDGQASSAAHLKLIDRTLGGQNPDTASRIETAQALVILKDQVDAIAARVGAVEGKSGETVNQIQGVARLIGRATAQTTHTASQSEARLHKLEVALADLRLDQLKTDTHGPSALEAVTEIAERMAELEERQADTLKALQSEIAAFIGESEQRFGSVEGRGGDGDLTKSFETLRVSVEERILGIELRSVRTLEQVADTVAMLEERLTGPEAAPEVGQKAG